MAEPLITPPKSEVKVPKMKMPKTDGTKRDVRKTIRQERGDGPELTSQQIVQKAAETEGLGDWQGYYAALQQAVQQSNFRILRKGNSLLTMKSVSPGNFEIHLLTADPPRKMQENFIEFAKALLKIGAKSATTTTRNHQIAKLAEGLRDIVNVQISTEPNMSGNEMMPSYRIIFTPKGE